MAIKFIQRKNISTESAMGIVSSALKIAKDKNYNISVSVVDSEGNVVAQARNDTAILATLSGAYKKAFTSNSLSMKTSDIVELIKNTPSIKHFKKFDDRILYMGGGVPIIVDGVCIGAVGVSGVPDPLGDEEVGLLAIQSIS